MISVPAEWEIEEHDGFTTLSDPTETSVIGLVIAVRDSSTLQQFAGTSFQLEEFMRPVSEIRPVHGAGWPEGVLRDFAGTYPGETEEAFRRVVCLRNMDLFAKVSFYTDPAWIEGATYSQILASIKLEPLTSSRPN